MVRGYARADKAKRSRQSVLQSILDGVQTLKGQIDQVQPILLKSDADCVPEYLHARCLPDSSQAAWHGKARRLGGC
jgi:hypothetical protein